MAIVTQMTDARKHEPAGSLERVVTRLVNPITFVLVLLNFVLASCIATSAKSGDPRVRWVADESFTGWNIATETKPFSVTVRILAIALLIVLVTGAATALPRSPQKRSFSAAVTATLSAGLLAATGLWASGSLDEQELEFLSILSTLPPAERTKFLDHLGIRAEISLGFWLGVAALAVIIAFNVYLVLRGRRRPVTPVH